LFLLNKPALSGERGSKEAASKSILLSHKKVYFRVIPESKFTSKIDTERNIRIFKNKVFVHLKPNEVRSNFLTDKGKPPERAGRKAMGLRSQRLRSPGCRRQGFLLNPQLP
jgi:hypothetical protein